MYVTSPRNYAASNKFPVLTRLLTAAAELARVCAQGGMMMLRSSRKRATVRRASRCGGGSAQEIPLPNDLLTYALAFAIENLHVWSNVRRVSSQFRRCLESPLALVHMAPVRANCWRLESPRALDHMAPAYASYWEGDLEFAPLVRSTCAAGVKALVLHTGAGGNFFCTVGNFPRVRQLLTLLALQKLSSFTALEHLSVEDPVTDGGLQALADTCSATLLTLRAYDTRVLTDQGLVCLAVLTHLQDLVLDGDGGCPGCTEPGLCAPLAKLADLRRLSLLYCVLVGEATMRVVGACASLQFLDLTECIGVTDAGLAALSNLGSLRTLVISWCTRVTDAGLAALAPVATLQELSLYACAQTTEAAHKALRARGVRVVCHSIVVHGDVSPADGDCRNHHKPMSPYRSRCFCVWLICVFFCFCFGWFSWVLCLQS